MRDEILPQDAGASTLQSWQLTHLSRRTPNTARACLFAVSSRWHKEEQPLPRRPNGSLFRSPSIKLNLGLSLFSLFQCPVDTRILETSAYTVLLSSRVTKVYIGGFIMPRWLRRITGTTGCEGTEICSWEWSYLVSTAADTPFRVISCVRAIMMSQTYPVQTSRFVLYFSEAPIQKSGANVKLHETSQRVGNCNLMLFSLRGSFSNPRQGCDWLLMPAPGAGPVWINVRLHPVSGLAISLAKGLRQLRVAIRGTFPVSLFK